jgi:hypothetical protein
MEYKVLVFHPTFDVLESSLNRWAGEGWCMISGWNHPANGHITIVMARKKMPSQETTSLFSVGYGTVG